MNKKTFKYLKKYIKEHTFGSDADYTLQSLFRVFENQEIKTVDDIFTVSYEFIRFLETNRNKILKNLYLKHHVEFEDEYEMLLKAFAPFRYAGECHKQSTFVRCASELFDDSNAKILDVGPGRVPLTSFMFKERFDQVYAMDNFLLSDEFIKATGVEPLRQYFNNSTDISNYDYIVGKRPCSAIHSIVETCAKQNKPYFLELCNCNLKQYRTKDGLKPSEWEDVLFDIDPNITFLDSYAFNIDASKSQVMRSIEGSAEHHQSLNNYPPFESLLALEFLKSCFLEIQNEKGFDFA